MKTKIRIHNSAISYEPYLNSLYQIESSKHGSCVIFLRILFRILFHETFLPSLVMLALHLIISIVLCVYLIMGYICDPSRQNGHVGGMTLN